MFICYWLFVSIVVGSLAQTPNIPLGQPGDPNIQMQTNHNVGPIRCSILCTNDSGRIWVEATFTNSADHIVAILERNLLRTNDLTWSAFRVTRNGQLVPYIGVTIKRSPPGPRDFYQMKPHESLVTKIELSRFYDFSKPGNYTIEYLTVNPPLTASPLFVIQSAPVSLNKR
jgi:hypothetical protein